VIPYIIMKRHLIESSNEKDELKQCPKTSLTILGNSRTLVGEDRDAPESRERKRSKLQDDRSKLRYLDLVSSAAKLLAEKDRKTQEETHEETRTPQDETCSAISTVSTTGTRGSRSNSVSSEYSVYRSYEMELPDQPHTECMGKNKLPRAPRLPRATDIPIAQEIGCQLNTRRYGERPAFIEGNTNESDQIQIQTVIYR